MEENEKREISEGVQKNEKGVKSMLREARKLVNEE